MDGEVFVGRESELAMLADLLAAVKAGAGGAVLVEGEQGIGKTALLRAGLGGAEAAGCRLGWAAADELTQRLPLRLMAECVGAESWLSGLGGGGVGTSMAAFAGDPVRAGVEQLLAAVDRLCERSPVVLVAEDLQWADEASLVMWQRLSRAVGQLPLLLAGSWRPGPAPDALARLRLGMLTGGRVLAVRPLPSREVYELVARLAGGRVGARLAGVTGRAGGNPLYARELVDALVRDGRVRVADGVAELTAEPGLVGVPDSLAAAVAQRLAVLSADAAVALQWAAVLGPEFSVSDLGVVSGRTAGELVGAVGEAVAAQLVAAVGPRLRFRHGLIRQVMYEHLPMALRVALHRQVARALAEHGAAADLVAAQLVLAFQNADPGELVDAWMLRWATEVVPALVQGAPLVAADVLRAILGQMPEADQRREAFEAALVTAACLLMRDEEVERVGRRMLARTRDPDRAAEVDWLLAQTLLRAGRAAEAAAATSAARGRPGVGPVWAARLGALQAIALGWDGQIEKSDEVAAAALTAAEQAGDRIACGYALHARGMASFSRRDEVGRLAYTDRGLAVIGDDPQATALRVTLLAARGSALDFLDRRAEALTTTRQAQALAERAGTPQVNTIRVFLACIYFDTGQWDDALAEAETGIELPHDRWVGEILHSILALIAARRDDQATAIRHLREVPDPVKDSNAWPDADIPTMVRALVAEGAGQSGEALAILAVCLDPEIAELMTGRFMLLPMLTRLALEVDDTATAAAAAEAAAQEADREQVPIKIASADHCRGLLAGDPAPVLTAAGYYQSTGRPADRAQALEDAAVLAAARGDIQAARQAFTTAIRLSAAVGAAWDIRRAETRLRRFGIGRPRGSYRTRPDSGWEALTPTEVTIARLVAAGRSNPDIASELFLSRNTVQTHVSHILAKLGQQSRAQIAVVAAPRLAGDGRLGRPSRPGPD